MSRVRGQFDLEVVLERRVGDLAEKHYICRRW